MNYLKTKLQFFHNSLTKLKNWQKNSVAFLLGSLLVLAFAPFHFFPIVFVSLTGFFWLIDQEKLQKKTAAILGFSFGFGFFLFGIYWISISLLVEPEKFAWLIPFALTLIPGLLAGYFAGFGVSFVFLKKKLKIKFFYQKIILFALLWLFFELLRAFLFSGFPWNLLGYSWLFNQNFAQIGSIFGVYGLSLFAAIIGICPIFFTQKKLHFGDKIFLGTSFAFLGFVAIFGYFHQKNQLTITSKNSVDQKSLKFLLVQANIAQENRWQEEDRYLNLIEHVRMSHDSNNKVDGIIWSESSIPFVVNPQSQELIDLLKKAVPEDGFLISGAIRADEDFRRVWNSIFVFDKNGIKSSYDKHHLVPFGEYVPFYRFFSFLLLDEVVDKITGGNGGGFSKGESAQTIKLPKFSFSPLVCYEAIFSSEVLDKKNEPDIFINLTNDAWFGTSIGPYQHLDIARMRAIEYQKPLLRVAATGISAYIDEFGKVVQKIALDKQEALEVEVSKSKSPSIYLRYGNLWLSIICIILTILLIERKSSKTI